MTKPFGYYTAYTPEDDSFLESLQQTYGDDFCTLNKKDKLALIAVISTQLCVEQPGLTLDETYDLGKRINNNLSISDRAGMIEALIAQVRWGQDLVVSQGVVPMEQ